jgi:hypothetical protein
MAGNGLANEARKNSEATNQSNIFPTKDPAAHFPSLS